MLFASCVGDGHQPVVLAHGLLGAGRNLSRLAKALVAQNPNWQVYLLDLPGHGNSPPLPTPADLETVAMQVRRWIDTLPQLPQVLIGHSLGGRVMLQLAAQLPHCKVVALDISPSPISVALRGDMGKILQLFFAAPESLPSRQAMANYFQQDKSLSPALIEWILTNLERRPDLSVGWRPNRTWLKEFHHVQSGVDLWPAAAQLAERLLVVHSLHSGFLSTQELQRLQAMGAKTVGLSEVGHFLATEAPEQVAAAIADFT